MADAHVDIDRRDIAWRALADYRAYGADFADSVIGASNLAAGCDTTATFDKKLGPLDTFTLLF